MPSPASAYVEQIVIFLMPYFLGTAVDADAARAEIIETLASYGTRIRSEMLSAAQIIAFGMSTLDTLGEARATEMSLSMRLRFRGCANGLNRSGQQNENTLAGRLGCDQPGTGSPIQEPVNDIAEPQVQKAIQHAHAKIDTYRNRLANTACAGPAPPASQKERNKRLWGSAMAQVLADMGMVPGPASTA